MLSFLNRQLGRIGQAGARPPRPDPLLEGGGLRAQQLQGLGPLGRSPPTPTQPLCGQVPPSVFPLSAQWVTALWSRKTPEHPLQAPCSPVG